MRLRANSRLCVIHLDVAAAALSRLHVAPRSLILFSPARRFRLRVLIKRLYELVPPFLRFSTDGLYDRAKYVSRTYNYESMSNYRAQELRDARKCAATDATSPRATRYERGVSFRRR